MKLLFWLYRSQVSKKGLMPLIMRITVDSKRVNFPVQISIEEKTWDKDKQRIRGNDELTNRYNQFLISLKAKAWERYNESVKSDKPIGAEDIKQYVLGGDATTYSLAEAFNYHLTQLRARVGRDVAPATIKNYETCQRKLEAFLEGVKGVEDIFLHQLNSQFVRDFDHFLRTHQSIHNNGVVKIMQQLKRVVKVAIMNEWLDKDPFVNYQCKIVEPKRVFLSQEELTKLEGISLPNERLSRVRDLFVFSCYTGLAYADVQKLAIEHIHHMNGRDWIILDRTKTKNQSTIPLLPKAKEILTRYSSEKHLLPVISSQNLNKYLKEVADYAGINKQLSFHAARHTFATTVTLNNGVDITTVSAMLGHRMLKTTQIYARVNLNKIANDVDKLYKGGG
jgi:site-specific recombinase XerD